MARYMLGDIELHLLLDAHTSIGGNKAFYPGQPAEWSPGFTVTEQGEIPNVVRTLLVREGDALTLVDTGFGEEEPGHPRGRTLERLADIGVSPEDISRVILTHAHGDHVLGNTVQRSGRWIPVFPSAVHVVQEAEVAKMAASNSEWWSTRFAPLAAMDLLELVEGRQRLSDALELWPTPGHTIGHQAIIIRSRDHVAADVGDLAVFAASFLRADWGPDWAWSRTEDANSRSAVAKWAVASDAVLIVPHDPDYGYARLASNEDGLSFSAAG